MSELAQRTETALAIPNIERGAVRPPVGLLLAIGEQVPFGSEGKTRPSKLDHFRAKPGKMGQYQREVAAFDERYGDQPKVIDDCWFLSDIVPHVLDCRLLAFSTTGFRGRGMTNIAALDPQGFDAKMRDPFTEEEFEFFPKDASEVRPELRDSWEGEPVKGTLTSPSDPRIARLGIKLVCQVEFMLPDVMGVGRVARISTSSRRSTRNLYSGVWDQWSFFGGRLRGVPFRLEVRPYSGQRFDKKERKYIPFNAYELVLDSALTYSEIRDAIKTRRIEIGTPTVEERELEARVFQQALALPAAGETDQTREEPLGGPPDALLNRIAQIQEEIEASGGDWHTTLRGLYGVDDPRALSADDAEAYWTILERSLPAEPVDAEYEPVDEPGEDVDESLPGSLAGESGDAGAEGAPVPATGSDQTASEGLTAAAPEASTSGTPAEVTSAAGGVEEGAAIPPAASSTNLLGESLADTVIPTGRYRGKTLGVMDDDFLRWAVTHPATWRGHAAFVERLRSYAAERGLS